MKLQQSVLEVQLTPFNILLRAVLSQLQERDQYNIFAQPVSIKEVSNHLSVNEKNLKEENVFRLRKISDLQNIKKMRCTSSLLDN